MIEKAGVSREIRSRRPSDWLLINLDETLNSIDISAEVSPVVSMTVGPSAAPCFHRVVLRSTVEHFAAPLSRLRPNIHQPLGTAHQLQIVLHNKYGITTVAEAVQGVIESLAVGGMKACRRLVQHVHHAKEQRAQLRGESQSLQLASGQCRRSAIQS